MKILYICPHLSTGGLPQYTLKQVQTFLEEGFEVNVIEFQNVSDDFIVQKTNIKELCPVFTLGNNKNEILAYIETYQPDVLHFQEVPESFIDNDLSKKLFDDDRTYNIVTTTHGSLTKPEELIFLPDKFVLVNEWSMQKFKKYFKHIPCEVWEYPIEKKTKSDKTHVLTTLNKIKPLVSIDPDYFHIINVGLFTAGKNQGEIFKVAQDLIKYKIQFHFIGNMAGNFASYWEPLMATKPKNCILWGEQDDTSRFYEIADLFYFSSLFELNPLVVKEALSYEVPVIMRNLETYNNDYVDNKLVTFIDDNLEETKKLILKRAGY